MEMARRPRHPKPDANQAQIFRDLRQCGLEVWNTSAIGGRVLDAVIGGHNQYTDQWEWTVWDVKAEGKADDLTDDQQALIADCPDGAVGIAERTEDVLEYYGMEKAIRWLSSR